MATNNTRDVKLTLSVGVTGGEDVEQLAGSLDDVATAGTGAAPGVEKLGAELAALSAKTKDLRSAEFAARAEVAAQKTARDEQRDTLARLRAETDKVGRATDEYKAQEKQLKLALIDSRGAIREKQAALESAVTAARAAAAAEQKLAVEIKATADAAHAQMKKVGDGVTGIGTATEGMAGILRQIGPLMAGAFSAQAFIGTITSAESLSRSFEQVFGSTAKARAEMEFIKTTANRLGLETLDLARSYQSLAAATKGTVLEGQATRDVFEAVSRAMSTLGKSTVETDRALVAISQIASKGTASMEELRGQLGEALPGALKAAADGAGITTEQLIEMVSSGSVLASDILPALTKGLNDLYGKAAPPNTVISEWARLKNVLTDTAGVIGEGGASKGLAKALSGVAVVSQYAAAEVDVLGTSIGELAAALASGNTELFTAEQVAAAYVEKIEKTTAATATATTAQTALTTAQNAGNTSTQQAGAAQDTLAKKLTTTGESLLAVKQKYGELSKGSADYVAHVEKEVAARTAETNVLTQLVAVYGTETERRQVAVAVAQTQVAVAEKLAAARNTEALITASYVIKLKEQALATGDVTEATKKQIAEAQKDAASKQVEFERTDALAKAKRIDAEATKAQTQALQDNSARVNEYRAAVDAAAREVARLSQLHKDGLATDAQVTEAKAKLSAATLLYRDALADATQKAERNIAVQQQVNQLSQASISVDMERVKAAQEVATAQGDAAKVTELATRATELQVRAAREQAEALRAEAAAMRAASDAREKELKARGELTAAAQDEIAARRRVADLKDLEAQKSDILAAKIYALAEANKSETATLEAKTSALERQNAAIERNNAAVQKSIDLENQRLGQDRDHFATDKNGQKIVAGGDLNTATGIMKFLQEAGVRDVEQAKAITREFLDTQGNVQYSNNPGQLKYGGDTISMALLKAAERITFGAAGTGGNNGFGGGDTLAPPTTSSTPAGVPPGQQSAPAKAATHLTINLASGVDVSSRASVEKLARAIMPAIDGLQRKGLASR